MAIKSTVTVELNVNGLNPGMFTQLMIPPSAVAADEALYLNNFWLRGHGVNTTIDPTTSLLEVGICPDQAAFPNLVRSTFFLTNFTGFVIGAADPVWRNGLRWLEPSLYFFMRWQGPVLSAVRWHAEAVLTYSITAKPITEHAVTLPLTPLMTWPVASTTQSGGI